MGLSEIIQGRKKMQKKNLTQIEPLNKEDRTAGIFPLNILDNLKQDLSNYVNLLPKLDEKKELVEQEINDLRTEIVKIEDTIPKLVNQKKNMEADIKDLEVELNAINNIKDILQKIR